jgi:hypothetical protein
MKEKGILLGVDRENADFVAATLGKVLKKIICNRILLFQYKVYDIFLYEKELEG